MPHYNGLTRGVNELVEHFYQDELATIYNADSTHLSFLDDESIDLTITSPPYNLDVSYNGYNDDVPYEAYLEWVQIWAKSLYRVSTVGGRACINVPLDTNKGGKRAVYADYVTSFMRVGWQYQTTIIWNEQNISRRTAWGSWRKPSAPFVTAPVEMIPVFFKETWRRPDEGRTWGISAEEFKKWSLGLWEWEFAGANPLKVGHPAPFPEELPRRLILMYSYEEDLILDPFVGSGTTCIAAKKLGRRSVGVEIDQSYCKLAMAALAALDLQPQLDLQPPPLP